MTPTEILHALDMYYGMLAEADSINRRLDEISRWTIEFERKYYKILTAINEMIDNAQKPL